MSFGQSEGVGANQCPSLRSKIVKGYFCKLSSHFVALSSERGSWKRTRTTDSVRTDPAVANCSGAHKSSPEVPFSSLWVQPNDCETDVFVLRGYVHKVFVEESDVLLQSASKYRLRVVYNWLCRN